MPCILHIETSAATCSVALSREGDVVFEREDAGGRQHSSVCGLYVEEALAEADRQKTPLDAVAVSHGPGSYTGLRIGLSVAKGVAYGRGVALLTVPTLEIMATHVILYRPEAEDCPLLAPMMDARRMEVYTAVYDRALNIIKGTHARIVDEDTYAEELAEGKLCLFGDGAEKCAGTIKHPNALFLSGVRPRARDMAPLAERMMRRGECADLAYSEPLYLKEFEARQQRKLL